MKLCERLGIQRFVDLQHLAMLRSSERYSPSTDFERAWEKFNRAHLQGLLALNLYMMDRWELARQHASACLKESDEFFSGAWRNQLKTPEGSVDPGWWRENLVWMEVFELCLLWGAALGEWEFLRHISEYPDESAHLSPNTTAQDRDSLIVISLILRRESSDKCESYLNRMSIDPRKAARCLAEALTALLRADAMGLAKNLAIYLHHYKIEEFPKENLTKKVSIPGTFLAHFALQQKITLTIPAEFEDYIVAFKS